jgi:DNA-binding response OmpR family regulator
LVCRTDYQVLVARDGEERLAIARREHPDLIILDLMLPRLDGLEVCRAIRCECDVPIIMLTARESEIGRLVGLELGADSREDQRLYRIPPSGIDRGMGGAPKGPSMPPWSPP